MDAQRAMDHDILLRRAQKGQGIALSTLCGYYHRRALCLAYGLLGERPLGDKAVEQAFVVLSKRLLSLRHMEDFQQLLWQQVIQQSSAFEQLRQPPRGLYGFWLRLSGSQPQWSLPIDLQNCSVLCQALQALPYSQRCVVLLRDMLSLPLPKISTLMGSSLAYNRSVLLKGRKYLQQHLASFMLQKSCMQSEEA